MATDHYTRLGIKKEKFYELDEKEKKELVDKQFRGLAGSLFSKLLSIFLPDLAEKRLVKLRDAMDILKDERVRKYYNFSLENGEKPNADYKSLKDELGNPGKFDQEIKKLQETLDSINSEMKNIYNSGRSIEAENLRKINTETTNIVEKMEKLDKSKLAIEKINEERIEQIKEELGKIKDGRETQKYDVTNKIIEHLESELKELNELNSQSKQSQKEVGQQDELTNIPPKFTNVSTEKNLEVLKEQFKKGLEKAGIDIKGMGYKEVLEKLKDNFLLNAQYEMIKKFEGKSEQPEQGKSEQQAKSDLKKGVSDKAVRTPLIKNVPKLVSNTSEESINFAQRELNRTEEVSGQQKGNGRSI